MTVQWTPVRWRKQYTEWQYRICLLFVVNLTRQRLHQTNHCIFRGTVIIQIGCSNHASHRWNSNNSTTVPLQHGRNKLSNCPEVRHGIHFHHPFDCSFGTIKEGFTCYNASYKSVTLSTSTIVHKNIDLSNILLHFGSNFSIHSFKSSMPTWCCRGCWDPQHNNKLQHFCLWSHSFIATHPTPSVLCMYLLTL